MALVLAVITAGKQFYHLSGLSSGYKRFPLPFLIPAAISFLISSWFTIERLTDRNEPVNLPMLLSYEPPISSHYNGGSKVERVSRM